MIVPSTMRMAQAAGALRFASRVKHTKIPFGAHALRSYATSPDLYDELTTPNGLKYKQPKGLFIGGDFVPSKANEWFEVTSPATGKKILDIAEGKEADVDTAVEAAETAFNEWSRLPPYTRSRALAKIADRIEERADVFAAVETWDNGKTIKMSLGDVAQVVQTFRYYAGWADKITGKVIETDEDHFNYVRKEPLGVCGMVIPWNFPLLMVSWKIAPALATGNTCVLKSAESTPLTALLFAEVIKDIPELPKGAVNILSGFGPVGGAISSHNGIKKVAFTGSTLTGRRVLESSAKSNLKKVTLELGGKSPNIVFNDAKLDEALDAALFGIFYNQGEVCCAGTRLFVQEGIYDQFVSALKERAETLKVGDPFDPEITYGAQTNAVQYEKVLNYIESGKKEGRLLTGGAKIDGDGLFIQPTIFVDLDKDSTVAREEVFGPVLAVVKFKDADEAVKYANDTEYGLASGVHTTSIEKAIYVANNLKAGTVWVNTYNALTPELPFGGYKASGIGRELGEEVLNNYLETKTVRIAGISTGLGAPKL